MIRRLFQVIKANRTFFIAYNLLLLIGLYPLLTWDKLTVFLFINKHHHPFLDKFFYYITHLGNGIAYGLLIIGLIFLKVPYKKLLIGIASFCAMSVIVQFLKRVIFYHDLRPIKFIELAEEAVHLHLVDNVEVLTHLSFPSVHAATIFAAACFLCLISTRKSKEVISLVSGEDVTELIRDTEFHSNPVNTVAFTTLLLSSITINRSSLYSLFLLLIAVLVAYSRVYLCQHFYTDVYIGALIGGWTTFFVYAFWIDRTIPGWLAKTRLFNLLKV